MALSTLLIIGPEPPPYFGAAVATKRLLDAGRRDSFRFHHVNTIDPAGTANMGKFVPANVVLAFEHYLRALTWLITRPDILAVYLPIAFTNMLAFWRDVGFIALARLFGKRLIVHCHDNRVEEFYQTSGKLTRQAVRWSLRNSRTIVVLCPRIGNATRRVVPNARIEVVPNGVSLAAPVVERTAHPDPPLVLFLSQLSEEKGFRTALHAAAALQQRGVAAQFAFAGGWKSLDDETRARHWVSDNALESTVRIYGPVTDAQKSELLAAADVFLFPTALRHEGQPLVLLEAMAAALPVITTDIGCIKDTVVENVTGFVLRPGDLDGIVDKLELLVRDAELRQRMATAGRTRYLADFTEERFIQRMIDVLRIAAPAVISASNEPGHTASGMERE